MAGTRNVRRVSRNRILCIEDFGFVVLVFFGLTKKGNEKRFYDERESWSISLHNEFHFFPDSNHDVGNERTLEQS